MAEIAEQVYDFARTFNDEIREKADCGVPSRDEKECFVSTVLEMFDEAGVVEEPEACVSSGRIGRQNWEIAGWAFPPSDEEDLSEMSILSVLFNDNPDPQAVTADDLRRRFELATNFVENMLAGRADELEPLADAAALGRLLNARKQSLTRITVHLATDGLTQRLKQIESCRIGDIEVACSIWDIERLSRLSDPKQEEIDIDISGILGGSGVPCLQVPEEDPLYEAYLCVVPGVLLFHAYEQYGQRLLELNVRSFLAVTGKVNKGIRETIREQPDRFFAYNNGLAMTARHVEIRTNSEGATEIVRIVGLQIVNGGQTTASIHRAWKLDSAEDAVRRVFVQAKLTVITTPEGDNDGFNDLVRSISQYANRQNAVKDDDLEANQPWHIAFEKLSRATWPPDAQSQWYYERSRGAYATEKSRFATSRSRKLEFEKRWPRSQLISKTDLAKASNAWNQRPEVVSLGGQKNFKHFMASLNDQVRRPTLNEAEFKRTVARVILLRDTTALVNGLKDRIPAYRANVVAYLISYLSFRMTDGLDFDRIWENQGVPETVKDVLRSWAAPIYEKIISSAAGRNPSEWCKKAECWTAIRELRLSTNVDLSRFASKDGVGVRSLGGLADVDEATAISECRRLTAADWEELCAWSMSQKDIHFTARGILSTLRGYALQNWTRNPSTRQAKAAARLIKRWRDEKDAV